MGYPIQDHSLSNAVNDVDEDFETFIANRRRYRGTKQRSSPQRTKASHSPSCSSTILNHPRRTRNYLFSDSERRPPHTMNKSQVCTPTLETKAQSLLDSTVTTEATYQEAVQSQALSTYGVSLADTADLDSFLESGWLKSPTPLQGRENTRSPIFVEQTINRAVHAQTSRTSSTSQLLPIDYDSDAERKHSTQLGIHPDIVLVREGRRKDKTRSSTMKDMFSQGHFVNSIRDNPYTSGIFTYKGLSKQETIEKVEHEMKSAFPRHIAKAARGKSGEDLRTPKRRVSSISSPSSRSSGSKKQHCSRIEKGNEAPIAAISRRRSATSTKSKFKPKSGALQTTCDLQQTATTVSTDAIVTRGGPALPGDNQSRAAATSLANFLHSQVEKYEQCLSKLDFPCVRNDERWRQLEAQIQSKIEYLVRGLQSDREGNAEIFKMNVQAWDMDIGAQAILQKYLVYSILLKRILDL